MPEKKPPHEVILEEMREALLKVKKHEGPISFHSQLERMRFFGQVEVLMTVLDKMALPERHLEEIAKALREMSTSWPIEIKEMVTYNGYWASLKELMSRAPQKGISPPEAIAQEDHGHQPADLPLD